MRKVTNYQVTFFWNDNTVIENVKDTYPQIHMNKFLIHCAIERLNQLPVEMREGVFYQMLKEGMGAFYQNKQNNI